MAVLLPPSTKITNGIPLYGKTNYLNSLIENNNRGLIHYADKTPWSLPNQHPLVQFLILLSLDISKPDEFIYNEVAYRYKQIASTCQMTSLRNPGISFTRVIFPEKEHHTLLVVPFKDDNDYKKYFNVPLDSLRPLMTLFTTDTVLRYDTTALTSSIIPQGKSTYTAIQVDPFALAIGYVRYCRKLIQDNTEVGVNPRAYITNLPLVNLFIQHNQNVIVNLTEGDGISVEPTKWNKIDISRELSEYLSFQRRQEGVVTFKSFQHYINLLSQGKNIGEGLKSSIYPDNGISTAFNQLAWAYNYNEMGWAYRYLSMLAKYNQQDSVFKNEVKKFLRYNIGMLTASIKDPLWNHLYKRMFRDLLDITA